ncbi:uncharacterized protein LOC112193244 isoform X2 [Rosa chinensis]|nr:uncharacterized protein LOC112193244 isoform X2 [Rosa chinensis]
MSKSTFGRFTYGTETILLPLSSSTTYENLCAKISSRFRNLKDGQFVFRYALNDCPNCYLECDDDILIMLDIFQLLNFPFIDIHVLDVGACSKMCVDKQEIAATVDTAIVNIPELVDEDHASSDDSNLEDDNNMIIGNFVSNKSKRKYMSSDWNDNIYKIGQVFIGGAVEFRDKLCKFAVEKGFEFNYVKNDKCRVSATCAKKDSDGCEWYVYASLSKASGYFHIIKLVNNHSCVGVVRHQNHKRLGSKVISTIMADKVRSDPLIKPKDIVKHFKHDYGFDIPYHMAYRGKEAANKMLHGSEAFGYSLLPWYIDTLKRTNPGSYCILDSLDNRFRRLFISYGACINGFKYCRPMLFLDGTFIKNKYKGMLLGACAKTGNKDVFPFAFAIVDAESKENWRWFLEHLAIILASDYRTIVFMTDRGAGLLDGVKEVFPNAPHSYCIKHLKDNLNGRYPSSYGSTFKEHIVRLFTQAAYARTLDIFNEKLEEFRKQSRGQGQSFLANLPPENYAIACFPAKRYGEMSNSLAESFNNMVKDERCMPLPQLLEGIRVRVMEIFCERKVQSSTWRSVLCPKLEKKLSKRIETGRNWRVSQSTNDIFEVCTEDSNVMVNLVERECSCAWWQFRCFPCSHAVQVMQKANRIPYRYIEDYWKTSFYRSAHDLPIFPVPDLDKPNPSSFGDSALQPPKTRKPPGRPRTRRIKSFGEESRPVKCTRCDQLGHHNRRSCNVAI